VRTSPKAQLAEGTFGANIQLKYAVPDESKNVAFYSKKINCNGDLLTPLI
jgi:hypothetical protein